MLLVIADTSPIRYLVQIGQIDLLPRLFGKILVPGEVARELRHSSAPAAVQSWMKEPPGWLHLVESGESGEPELTALDPGERSAIALGIATKADLILIDERRGARVALSKGLKTTGTLGVLDLAAKRSWIRWCRSRRTDEKRGLRPVGRHVIETGGAPVIEIEPSVVCRQRSS